VPKLTTMKKTGLKEVIQVPAERAWQVIARLTGLEDFVPGVIATSLQNEDVAQRIVTLSDGTVFRETILKLDIRQMELMYDIQDPSPLPYSNLNGFLKIVPVNMSSCEIRWAVVYQADEFVCSAMISFMEAALRGLEKYCRVLQAN
jgi:ribosome-associated toxin RatA of RatAB toxin-antitoxin module